jgi:hypothetical protein
VKMMMEMISSETSVLTKATRRHILGDGILHCNACLIVFVVEADRARSKTFTACWLRNLMMVATKAECFRPVSGFHSSLIYTDNFIFKKSKQQVIKRHVMKRVKAWRCCPSTLDLGTSWGWIVRFRPRPLHPRGTDRQIVVRIV